MRPLDFEKFTAAQVARAPEGQSIDAAVRHHLRDPVLQSFAVVELDGETVPRADWATTILKAGQRLRVALRPRGETGRKVLRTVLLIAVVVVATWITAGGIAALGSGFTASIAAAGFTAVASLAINALIPPPGLGDGAKQEVDPTYSLSGTRNQMRQNAAIPITLGSHRYTPDLITQQYQEVVGDDIWLRFGVCWGVGSYEVEDLRIGETPISEFDGIQVQHQLTPDAPPTTLIRSDFTQDAVGATLDTGWTTRRTAADAADAEILIQFPRGLGTQDDKGNPKAVTVGVDVRVRAVNDDDTVDAWTTLGTDDPALADQIAIDYGWTGRSGFLSSGIGSAWPNYVAGLGAAGVSSLGRVFSRSDFKPFSAVIPIALPTGKRFDISVRRTTTESAETDVLDTVNWAILTTHQIGDVVRDPRLATSFFRIKASDQLSGQISELNGLLHRLARTYDGPSDPGLATLSDWNGDLVRTSNNADVLLEAAQGAHTLVPTPDDEINAEDLARFWHWCFDNDFTFNLPIDGGMSRGDLFDAITRVARARTFRQNGQIRIAIDRPRPEGPSQILTERNAWNFSFTRSFAPPIHALQVVFPNAANDHRDDTMRIYAEGFDDSNATLIEDTPMPGLVHADDIHGYGQYLLAQMAERTLIASCDMDVEFETLGLGDYVRLAHPVLDETVLSARVLDQTARVIAIDTAHDFDPAQSYVLRHRRINSDADGAWLDCQGLYPIVTPTGRADQLTLADDLPDGVSIAPDDLVIVGIAGQDSFEGLIRDIEPTGPRAARVEMVAYLPDTLINPPASGHTPSGVPPFAPVPAPSLVGVAVDEETLSVSFDIDPSLSARLARLSVRHRAKPPVSATGGVWTEHPSLPADARSLSLAITIPDQIYEVEITAVTATDRRSAPLRVESSGVAPRVPAPAGVSATPGTVTGPTGTKVPVLDITVDPVDTTRLSQLIVEARTTATADPWVIVATASSAQVSTRVFGLPPGSVLDIRLAWQTPRGVLTGLAARPVLTAITIPETLVSTGSLALGDRGSKNVFDDIDSRLDAVDGAQIEADANAFTNAARALLEAADATQGAQIQELQETTDTQATKITALDANQRAVGGANLLARDKAAATDDIADSESVSGWGRSIVATGTTNLQDFYLQNLKPNTAYSASFKAKISTGTKEIRVDFNPDTLPETAFTLTTEWQYFTWENVSTPLAAITNCRFRIFGTGFTGQTVDVTDVMLVESPIAAPWSQAPAEVSAKFIDVDQASAETDAAIVAQGTALRTEFAAADNAIQGQVTTNTASITTNATTISDETSARTTQFNAQQSTNSDFDARIAATDLTVVNNAVSQALATEVVRATLYARDGVIPDPGFYDNDFWRMTGLCSFEDASYDFEFPRVIRLAGAFDFRSQYFRIEPGQTYRIVMQVVPSNDYAGYFQPLFHMPLIAWWGIKLGAQADRTATSGATVFETGATPNIFLHKYTAQPGTNNSGREWQFRFRGNITAGHVDVAFSIQKIESYSDIVTLQSSVTDFEGFTEANYGTVLTSVVGSARAIAGFAIRTALGGIEAVSEFVIFANKITLASGTAVFQLLSDRILSNVPIGVKLGDNALYLFPNASMLLWYGDKTIALAAMSNANAILALDSSGNNVITYQGANLDTTSPATYSGDAATGTSTTALTVTVDDFKTRGNAMRASLVFKGVGEGTKSYLNQPTPPSVAAIESFGDVDLTLEYSTNDGSTWTTATSQTNVNINKVSSLSLNGGADDYVEIITVNATLELDGSATVAAGSDVRWRAKATNISVTTGVLFSTRLSATVIDT